MKAKSLNTVVFSTIAIFALGTVESGLANTSYEDGAWIKRGILDKRKKSPQHSGADARRLLQRNVQVFSLVPSDISAGEASFRCNEGGIRTDLMSGYCIDYHSASERTSWRLRYEQSGRIDRVFKFRGYKNRYASFDLWAVFDNSLYGERGSVSFTSPEAEKVHEEQNPHAVRGGKKEQDNNEQDNNETTSQGSQTF